MRISPTAPRSRESSPATIRSAASGTNMKRAHPRYRRTWNPRNSPFGSDQDTSTDSTRAWGWDVLFHSMHVSIMERSPSKTASTLPSHRFSTYPSSPSDSALSAQYARKLTPCTRPRKTTTARTFTAKRNETTRKNFIVATGDSTRRCREPLERRILNPSVASDRTSDEAGPSSDGILRAVRRSELDPGCRGITNDGRRSSWHVPRIRSTWERVEANCSQNFATHTADVRSPRSRGP